MNRKRIVSVVCVVLAFVFIAGCGNASRQPGASAPAAGAPAGIKTLKIMSPNNSNPEIRFANRNDYTVWEILEDKFTQAGIKPEFELIEADQYQVVIQTRIASSTDLPDVANITALDNVTAVNLGNDGILLDIHDILNNYGGGAAKDFITARYDHMFKLNTTPSGDMYWYSQVQRTTFNGEKRANALSMLIRIDWLEALGIGEPTSADEFYLALKAFRDEDVNGNGTADEILYLDPGDFRNGVAQWYGLGPQLASINIVDNTVTSPWYQPGVIDYFIYVKKLADENILDASLIGAPWEQVTQKVAANQMAAFFEYAIGTWHEPNITGHPDAVSTPGYLPIAFNEAASGRATPALTEDAPFMAINKWAFTKNCDKNSAAALLNVIYSEDYLYLNQYGIEGETFDFVNGIPTYQPDVTSGHFKERGADGRITGDWLWGPIFPAIRISIYDVGVALRRTMGFPYKADFEERVKQYPASYTTQPDSYMAITSDEVNEEISSITTDLNTYSSELATKLVLGQSSLDDWDKYMKDFENLKLQRLLDLTKLRVDSYLAK